MCSAPCPSTVTPPRGIERSTSPPRVLTPASRAGSRSGFTTCTDGGTSAASNWYANLRANPHFVFHLKNGPSADLPATATIITDPQERRRVFEYIVDDLNQPHNPGFVTQPQRVEDWMEGSPLVEIAFDARD
jgi:hypothetical protein